MMWVAGVSSLARYASVCIMVKTSFFKEQSVGR